MHPAGRMDQQRPKRPKRTLPLRPRQRPRPRPLLSLRLAAAATMSAMSAMSSLASASASASASALARPHPPLAFGSVLVPPRRWAAPLPLPPPHARSSRPARPGRGPAPLPAAGLSLEVLASAASNLSLAALTDPSTVLAAVTDAALRTPPAAYLILLLAAGFGLPVSEDALCVFAGAASPSLPAERRATLVLCLYAGVVLSDAITFLIGRSLRMGIMDPVRRRMGPLLPPGGGDDAGVVLAALAVAGTGKGEGTGTGEGEGKGTPLVAPPGSSRMHRRLARCGDRIGFVTRLSVGVRGPLMLLAGFSGSVPFGRFALGSALGGVLSLSLQLLLGYWLRDHPGAVVGTVAGASTVVCAAPIAAAVLSGAALVRRSWKLRQPTAAAEAADLLDSR